MLILVVMFGMAVSSLSRLDVDRIFGLDVLHLEARQQAKELDVFVQVLEFKFDGLARGQAPHPKAGKVADHHQLGHVALGHVVQVGNGLAQCFFEVFAARLVLDQQHPGPKQVHEATLSAELFDVLLEGAYAFVGDAKDFKEVNPKGFGFAVFVAGIGPGLAKKQRPRFNFVPIKKHLKHPQSLPPQ